MSADDWQKMSDLLHQQRMEFREDTKLICRQEIGRHESGSWSHNPKRALTLGALVIGVIEGIRKWLHP
jgi:hypothetical protein